jgi:hypothetical protein
MPSDWTACSAKECGEGVQHKLVLSKDAGSSCPSYNVKVVVKFDITKQCSAAKPCPGIPSV